MPFDPKRKNQAYTVGGPVTLYWQDGKHWDHEGNECDLNGNILTPAPKPPPKKVEVGPEPLPPARKGKAEDDDAAEAKEPEDQLEAWARNEISMPFFKVKQACLDKYGKTPATAVEARKIIAGG